MVSSRSTPEGRKLVSPADRLKRGAQVRKNRPSAVASSSAVNQGGEGSGAHSPKAVQAFQSAVVDLDPPEEPTPTHVTRPNQEMPLGRVLMAEEPEGSQSRGEKRKEAEADTTTEDDAEPLKRRRVAPSIGFWNSNWTVPESASAFEEKFYPQLFKAFVFQLTIRLL